MVRLGAKGLVVVGLGQVSGPAVDAVDGPFELSEGRRIEALGVCRIEPSGVTCWNRAGASVPDLARKIDAYYTVQNGSEVSFRPGRKNRYVVFGMPSSLNYQLGSEETNYMNATSFQDEGTTLVWARTSVPPEAKTFAVTATLTNFRQLPPGTLPFVRGQVLEYQGMRFEIGESQPLPPPPGGAGYNAFGSPFSDMGKLWSVVWGQRGAGNQTVDFSYSALDKKNELIRYVDAKGQPVTEMQYVDSLPKSPEGGYFGNRPHPKGYHAALFTPSGSTGTEGVYTVQTNIDPARIGAIRIVGSEKRVVSFGGLPADPN
ncbi:hypothetical protein BH11ARM2_BH11ARM2_16020 [soil metagenome]